MLPGNFVIGGLGVDVAVLGRVFILLMGVAVKLYPELVR